MNDCYYDRRDWRSCKKEVGELSFSGFPNISPGGRGRTEKWRDIDMHLLDIAILVHILAYHRENEMPKVR
jgi:hypothetical protein